ncbi:hypothetical protein SmJEL517_g03826 [Synchytrium microbalum]|uniref:Store-operated calcium entry-associated regulatory factor n=1 Tax=Synchytrium microbalum TaxID=1806994 RepID=A0A507C1H6_9FUNG|nr:uncharacterized protein SmJEL517_g03826 [Synchytrium microbalum]TPX33218.1 hypothetical protein SmJEL517_g03826 [Synchytrium microbalum]
MHTFDFSLTSLLLALILQSHTTSAIWNSNSAQHKKILLRDITTLTFKDGALTTGRRSRAIPQLTCIGGDACGKVLIPAIQCRNTGWDGDVQWQCQSELSDEFKFGTTEVTCEGFDYTDDPYVLRGSCGVEYTLYYTEKGRKLHKQQSSWFSSSSPSSSYDHTATSRLAKLVWFSVAGLMLYSLYVSWWSPVPATNGRPASRGTSGGSTNNYGPGGNGGGGGGGFGPFGGFSPSSDPSCAPSSSSSSGPGFWSGTLLGTILGSLLSPNRRAYYAPQPAFMAAPAFGGGLNGFGGYGSPNRGFGGASSSSAASSRMASGYGGTRRR